MVYIFLADGFEEIEALAPLDILKRSGIEVLTVGVTGKTVSGAHGVKVQADILPGEVDLTKLRGAVLPGGMPGADNLAASKEVADILEFAYKNDLLIGAICAAPYILGERGYLKGRKATCYTGYEAKLIGAKCTGKPVVCDGNIITARGAGVALSFGFEIAAALKGKDTAKKVKMSMLCE
ncbi:MAG: DJ-1/PfpI family protein [Clostridia bacterium]|nr:DJ-1/PfpI family protein [Clostridia bacterium]